MENLNSIHNLMLNCKTENELSELKNYYGYNEIKSNLAAYPLTVLSPYYFDNTKKDLIGLHSRTYISKNLEIFGY